MDSPLPSPTKAGPTFPKACGLPNADGSQHTGRRSFGIWKVWPSRYLKATLIDSPFRVLRLAPFRKLWAANLLSLAGSQISHISLILYLSAHTNRMTGLAILLFCQTVPGAVATIYSGVVVDRYDKRQILLWSDLVRMALLAVAAMRPTGAVIYPVAALHSIASAFFGPARSASLPLVVGQQHLTWANAMDQGAFNVILVLAPVIGAELFLRTGVRTSLLIDAASFLASALFLWTVTIRRAEPAKNRSLPCTGADYKDGWRYLFQHPLALHLVSLGFVSLLCVGLWTPLAPFFIRNFLNGSDRVLGVQLAMFGLGGISGALLAPSLIRRWGQGRSLFLSLLAEGGAMTIYSLVPSLTVSVALLFLWGNIVSIILVPYYSLLQQTVEEGFLGRTFAVARQSESVATVGAILTAMALQRILRVDQIFLTAGLLYVAFVSVSAATRSGQELLKRR